MLEGGEEGEVPERERGELGRRLSVSKRELVSVLGGEVQTSLRTERDGWRLVKRGLALGR